MGLGAPDLAGASVQQCSELGGVWELKDGYDKASATYFTINSIYIIQLSLLFIWCPTLRTARRSSTSLCLGNLGNEQERLNICAR